MYLVELRTYVAAYTYTHPFSAINYVKLWALNSTKICGKITRLFPPPQIKKQKVIWPLKRHSLHIHKINHPLE